MAASKLLLPMLLLLCAMGAARADTWTRDDDIGKKPVAGKTEDKFAFSASGAIDVKGVDSNVQVRGGNAAQVELLYERSAATQQDYDCETLRYEHTADHLTVRLERKHERACHSMHATDRLTLVVPRQASVSLAEIGDSAHISDMDGMIRLSSIGDSATLENIAQLRADSIGDSLRLSLQHIGPGGIHVDSVGDNVELDLPDDLGAQLTIDSVGGSVRGHGMHLSELGGSFSTTLGKGGPDISISSVGDDVILR